MDRRERDHQWYTRFDESRMKFILEGWKPVTDENGETWMEDVEIPAKYEVCETCEGRGTHVNPSIDSHGLTAEDFAEDPDFMEGYFSGRYDVPCAECGGRRVAPVVSDDCPPKLKKIADEAIQSKWEMEACYAAERRMGA